jgi:copper chaperone
MITVKGMSCEHCVRAVQEEVGSLPGVTGVEVDLAAGTVRVTADPAPDTEALRAAVDAAGYEMTG